MKKTKINSLQLGALTVSLALSIGNSIGIYSLFQIAKIDSYISVIIAAIMGIIPIAMIIYISSYKEELNIVEKTNDIFGKKIGTIINILIAIIMFIIVMTILFAISYFLVSQLLYDTPIIIPEIIFAIIIYYALCKGIEAISRVNLLLWIFAGIVFIFIIINLFPHMELDNLKPVLENGINKPLLGSLNSFLINIVPFFSLLIIPKDNIIDKKNYNKSIIIFYIISSIIIFLVAFLTIGILGPYLAIIYQYPEYIVLKKISLFNFIDRIENLLSVEWIFSSFSLLTLLCYYITNTIKKNDKPKISSFIIVTLVVILSIIIFFNNTIFNIYINNIFPYILFLLFILYSILTLGIIIKKHNLNK